MSLCRDLKRLSLSNVFSNHLSVFSMMFHVKIYTTGTDHAEDDFRLLLKRALAEPTSVRLRTATMVLRLAPQGIAGGFPEVDQALLRVSPSARRTVIRRFPALNCSEVMSNC